MTTSARGTLIVLIVLAVCPGLIVGAKPDAKTLLQVPKARYLFGISVAPSGQTLLVYRSSEVPEGEAISGTAVLVKLRGSPEVLPLGVPSVTEDLTSAVWGKQGRKAYILTSSGIYSVNGETGMSKLIVRGALAGLAISPDGTRLAFWNLGSKGTQYTLSVFDISSSRTVKTWRVATRFNSDQYGHEIVFSHDGSSVFARTYDEEDRTPLEQFHIIGGRVHTVWPDCVGLARGSKQIYFIGEDHGVGTLFKIGPSSPSPQTLVSPFGFDSLTSSGTQRWVIATNDRSRRLAVLDSETDKLSPVRSACENAAVLPGGQVVCSRGGDLIMAGRYASMNGQR